MSKRVRITAIVATLCVCLSLFVVGVLSATTATLNVTSTLRFEADGVYVMVDGKLKQGTAVDASDLTTSSTYTGYSYSRIGGSGTDQHAPDGSASSSTFLQADGTTPAGDWAIGEITFTSTNKVVIYEFTVSNYSEFDVTATITTNIAEELADEIANNQLTLDTYKDDIKDTSPSFTFDIPARTSVTTPGSTTYKIVVTLTNFMSSISTNEITMDFLFEEYEPPYRIEQENIGGKDYTFVYFGNYPQTYVGNDLNTTLENAFDSNNPELTATGKTYTTYDKGVKITADDLICKEYEYNGELYARVPQADVYNGGAKTFNDGTTVVSKSTYWFKVEPIKWRVLTENYTDIENTTPVYYLLSEFCLTCNTTFNPSTSNTNHTYYSADTNVLRPFLNEEFCIEAFTEAEQALISTRTLTDADMDGMGSVGDIPSTEPLKVWAPSYYDMLKYDFKSSPLDQDSQRRASATDFAMANYAYKSTSTSYQDIYGIGATYYWTSSAASASNVAYIVYSFGYMIKFNVYNGFYAARPALLFNL